MRVSEVVKSDDEIRAEMKGDNASAAEIAKAIDRRQDEATKAQETYDKKTSAPFVHALQSQNQ